MAILEVINLKKSFGAQEVLKGINFEMDKGEVVVIIGSSGSGKTTLLRCLNFLETADDGQIIVDGETLFDGASDKNEKYIYFGSIPDKLDDAANYLPSRLAALLWVAAAAFTRNDAKGAWKIWRRDRRNHASPNSAQTESACAGALGVQLAGPAYYFGEYYAKPTIGDPLRPIEPEDILRANRMMYVASAFALAWGVAIRAIL